MLSLYVLQYVCNMQFAAYAQKVRGRYIYIICIGWGAVVFGKGRRTGSRIGDCGNRNSIRQLWIVQVISVILKNGIL